MWPAKMHLLWPLISTAANSAAIKAARDNGPMNRQVVDLVKIEKALQDCIHSCTKSALVLMLMFFSVASLAMADVLEASFACRHGCI